MSNQLLEDIARLKPRTVDNLAALNGVGPFTLRQYGKKVIALVLQNAPEIDDRIQGVNTDAFWDSIKAQKKPKKSAKKGSEAELEAKKKELQMKKAKRRQLQVMTEEAIAELEAENTVDIEELNSEQQQASTHILQGNNVFVTGSAGTGKSYLLRYVIQELLRKYGEEGVAVTAPTGIAAININGMTVHSFAGIGLGLCHYIYSLRTSLWDEIKFKISFRKRGQRENFEKSFRKQVHGRKMAELQGSNHR
jgi:hypothetical protein